MVQEQTKEAKRLAAATALTAKLTASALNFNRNSFEIQTRAQVVLKSSIIDQPVATQQPAIARLVFTNAGKTPGLHIRIEGHHILSTSSFEFLPYGQPSQRATKEIVYPGQEIDLLLSIPVLGSNQLKLYVYGTVRFQDVYGKRHAVRFCTQYEAAQQALTACV